MRVQSLGVFTALALAAGLSGAVFQACKTVSRSQLQTSETDSQELKPIPLLDTNDVSVLFSYDRDVDTILPNIPMADFVSESLYQQIKSESERLTLKFPMGYETVGAESLENWKIISFRFDPCAPSSALANGEIPAEMQGKVPGCLVQLRLIAQPLAFAGQGNLDNPDNPAMYGKKVPRDFIAHIVYNIGVLKGSKDTAALQKNFEPYLPLVRDLAHLKEVSAQKGFDTNGALMGVYPSLKGDRELEAQALAACAPKFSAAWDQQLEDWRKANPGKFPDVRMQETERAKFMEACAPANYPISQEISAFLHKYLKQDAMQLIAFMGIHGSSAPWRFFNGHVTKTSAGEVSFVVDPLSGFAKADTLSQTAPNQDPRGNANYNDGPDRELSLKKLFGNRFDANASLEGGFAIENPITTHALNMDCTSCHSLQFPLYGSRLGFQGFTRVTEWPKNRWMVPRGVTAFSPTRSKSAWNLHNFAYFVDEPTISPRTISETAAVVQLTNRLIGGDQAVNPGMDCGDDPKVYEEIFKCGMKQDCFKSCTINGK